MTKELINRLFPNLIATPEEYEKKYPPRKLSAGAMVTRFSPSPTGFLHIGGIMAGLLSERLAHASGGSFLLRLEDTDKEREMAGAADIIVRGLDYCGLFVDEGVGLGGQEVGSYGPYIQSDRKEIYGVFIKYLVEKGFAYPCFATSLELEKHINEQEALKLRPGYYGRWATWRDENEEKINQTLDAGRPFAIRMRSTGSHERKTTFHDEIKGDVQMPENDLDIVLSKSDGLPTYHFAHAVDDHLMRVTHVVRGDEWFPSLPIHLELFKMFGWEAPKFCHIAPVQKMDGGSRRKISKRKDPEASVEYYEKEGYPAAAIQEFLLNLLNSNFEGWRKANPTLPNVNFKLSLAKMPVSGALFDMIKFIDVSKETIARLTAEEVYSLALEWAEKFDPKFSTLLKKDKAYAVAIFSMERGGEKTRKDIAKWSDVQREINYFYDELFLPDLSAVQNAESKEIVKTFLETYSSADTKETWLLKVRNLAEKLGYARDTKNYKANPTVFKGTLSQITNVLRLLTTGRAQSPDLYEIMKILGEKRVRARLAKI